MAKNKFTKIDSVPPTMPIDWRAWESSPVIQNMSDSQLGIALKIMLKQWMLGSLPHSAYRMSVVLQSRYETTQKFLQTYPKFVVCSEHGCSWDVVGLECPCTADVATVVCQKTKNFYIDANSGLPLGTTEPNRTYMEPNKNRTVADEDESFTISQQIEAPKVKFVEEIEHEVTPPSTIPPEAPVEIKEVTTPQGLVSEFGRYLGRRIKGTGSPSDQDEAARMFGELLEEYPAKTILTVMEYGFMMNERYGPGMKQSKKRSPWLMFKEEFDNIKIAMEADADRKDILRRRTSALAVGASTHALKNPELHTGLDAQGESLVRNQTKI